MDTKKPDFPIPPPRAVNRVFLYAFLAIVIVLGALLFVYLAQPPKDKPQPDDTGKTAPKADLAPKDRFAEAMNSGKNYLDKGEAQKAIPSFEEAVKLMPTHPDAHLNLANAYLLAGRTEKAIQEAREVLNLEHRSAAAHYVMGCALSRQRNFEEALKALETSHNIEPAVAAVSFQLGRVHLELGHLDEAIFSFGETLIRDSKHPSAHYQLSQALLRAGRNQEAQQHLDEHQKLAATRPVGEARPETYERCVHTEARVPFYVEQPDGKGIPVKFSDATKEMLGEQSKAFRGPVAVLDVGHDDSNDLFVLEEGRGFRLLRNTKGRFAADAAILPARQNAKYRNALVGDLQNDQQEDVILFGENASQVFKFATNGIAEDVTEASGLANAAARDGALVDVSLTGKLGLMTLQPDGSAVRVWRNLGTPLFNDITEVSGLPASLPNTRQVVVDDWNNDDLPDVFAVRDNQPLQIWVKQRGGPLVQTNAPSDWPAPNLIAVGDVNNDLRNDVVMLTASELVCCLNGLKETIRIPLKGQKLTTLLLVDYDNDGWLDIIGGGEGLFAWRNLGSGGFQDVTASLGFDKLVCGTVTGIHPADFDVDCDTDLLLAFDGPGLQLLRNDGGNANRQLKLRVIGQRSNASGIGIHVEARSGGLRVARSANRLPLEIGVGKRDKLESVNVRWHDLSINNADVKVDCSRVLWVSEVALPSGSCPYLYAWDGKRFRFVTDLLGAAPMGLRITDNHFIDADPDEFVWIGNEASFPARDGYHVLQITEELREVLYLDEAKLVVVDHPPGTEVHPTSKLLPGKPFLPHELVTLRNPIAPRHATHQDGSDVTEVLRNVDNVRVSPLKQRIPQLRGLAEPFAVTLDFGSLPVERPLVLVLNGWLRFGGGMANVGASHEPGLPFPFPTLEVQTADGKWQQVNTVVGAPAGKTKTIIADLTVPAGAKQLRLTTAFEIHWDRIVLMERADSTQTRITSIAATRSDLHWRGFSEFMDLPWHFPLTPDYERVKQAPNWRITPYGWCTRYGAVDELINGKDNALALLNGGDELTLHFATGQLPPKTPGTVREFFLFTSGWDKDADFHVEKGFMVEPLPWHGMDDQRYGKQERPAFENDAWMKKFNTRWVAPQTFTRGK